MVYLKSVENVITLGKLIGLFFLFCLLLLSILFLKTKRNDLARPVMGTIFLVVYLWVSVVEVDYSRYSMPRLEGREKASKLSKLSWGLLLHVMPPCYKFILRILSIHILMPHLLERTFVVHFGEHM